MRNMVEIRAIFRPSRLPRLREALRALPNFPGVTVCKAEGFTAPAVTAKQSAREELTDFSDKLMLCVLADEQSVPGIRQTILDACKTGQVGDGIVWTVPIATMHRIRNGSDMRLDP